jgi:dCMP deaminase
MSWDKRWIDLTKLVATWSKDRSRKCGAVIVDDRNVLVSIGWNGFPRGINDDVDSRHERPLKYKITEHSERNAIYNAAANGHPTRGCKMYISWYPCADCIRAIIQSGIVEIICIEPDWNDHIWAEDFKIVKEMCEESGLICRFLEEKE